MAVAGLSNACVVSMVGAVRVARNGVRRRWPEWMVLHGRVHATPITPCRIVT
jgi:hypothetical protein